jgi:hypothetical protein
MNRPYSNPQEEFTYALKTQSKCMLETAEESTRTAIKAQTQYVFTKHNPLIQHYKQTTHMRQLHDNMSNTQLSWFFSERLENENIERIQTVELGEDACSMLLKMNTTHGVCWMNVQTNCDGVRLKAIHETVRITQRITGDPTIITENKRVNIFAEYTHSPMETTCLIMTHIDPYICAFCYISSNHMQKCKKCWEDLQINVRYCGKDCQRAHYKRQHKHVCGKWACDQLL